MFNALGLALLDIICIPFALICCVAFWRLPSVCSKLSSDSIHSVICQAAGNALIDLVLLPAAILHVLFPWRIPTACSTGFDREAILISALQGFVDLPFALMALVCCVSLFQSYGMVSEVGLPSAAPTTFFVSLCAQIWRHLNGTAKIQRDTILDRFCSLLITLAALCILPLSLHRIFQINFRLIGGDAKQSLKLLEVISPHKSCFSCVSSAHSRFIFDCSKSVCR